MAYIRMKSIRGIKYAYLVESVWNKERKQPKQRTIKYLGRVESIDISDIPEEYRDDPNIIKFLNMVGESRIGQGYEGRDDLEGMHGGKGRTRTQNQLIISEDNKGMIEMFSSGDVDGLLSIYKDFLERYRRKDMALLEFYEQMIIPALNEVGHLWMRDELGIAIEHVCSNTMLGLIQVIENHNSQIIGNYDVKKGDVLICTPYGDLHSIPCKMVESMLVSKGYKVYNIAPSTPRETVLKYVEEIKPSIVIVSVTLSSRAKAAERLVGELLSSYGDRITVIVGGRGSNEMSINPDIVRVENLRQLASLL